MSGVKIKPKELKPDPDLVSTPREERRETAIRKFLKLLTSIYTPREERRETTKVELSKLPKPDPSLISRPREGT